MGSFWREVSYWPVRTKNAKDSLNDLRTLQASVSP
jgi:hypothetical protein